MYKDQLYLDLKKKILAMVLEPGESLDEKSLSEQYLISRTPLRNVFGRLAGEGFLTLVSNNGTSVSSMNHKTMRDFFYDRAVGLRLYWETSCRKCQSKSN
jgi:DNA-binding GntR family transcriptional regulator